MNIQPHFKELLKLFEENKVSYMIVGGYAVAFYGYPRFTKDLDLFYELSQANISRIKKALLAFGFAEADLGSSLFSQGNIIKIGVEPIRIDLLNQIDGISFFDAVANVVNGNYDDLRVQFIGREDLLKNKRASGRPQDLADLDHFGE